MRTEKDLLENPYNENQCKTCPDCLGKGRLRKVGEYKYERL
ncbi:MAG: hypothetical protein ACLFM7_13805 [Bacteroidales bacterium]